VPRSDGSTGSTFGGYSNRSATSRRRSTKHVTISRLRRPESTNSLSEDPGTIQLCPDGPQSTTACLNDSSGVTSSHSAFELPMDNGWQYEFREVPH
jgi:hypothetical protein